MEELCLGYFTQGKYIGDRYVVGILSTYVDCWLKFSSHINCGVKKLITLSNCCRDFLLECARKAGVEGAAEFLETADNGVKEVLIQVIDSPLSSLYLVS